MDTEIKELVDWIIALTSTSFIAIILGVINIVRAGKLLPKEVKQADLNNRSKEVSIASQFDELATKAAEKTLQLQERLDTLEINYHTLKDKVEEQEKIIEKQKELIDQQALRITAQEDEIAILICEIDNYKKYNSVLIEQIKNAHLIPIEIKDVPDIKECADSPVKRRKNKQTKETEI